MTDHPRRRAQKRYDIRLPVVLTYQGTEHKSESVNLSLGGMFVTVVDALPFGALVLVKFKVPALKDEIAVEAHVRWVGEEGMGLQFGGLRPQQVWGLQKLFDGRPESK